MALVTLPSNLNSPIGNLSGATLSPGVQATSPAANVKPPSNSLSASQTAPAPAVNDLSANYANVNGTIYNKGTGQAYSTPQQFFAASGVNSFNNLKFDTSWTPPTVSNGLLQAPGSTSSAAPSASSAAPAPSSTGLISSLATPTTPAPTTATGAPAVAPAPNGGTTGVSQGGLIQGLASNASSNPAYQQAIAAYNAYTPQIQALQSSEQNQITAASQDSGDMNLSLGRQGQITQNTGGLISSLSNAQAQQLAAANAAIGEQGATTTGLNAATSANAPITGVQPGTITIQPSQTNGSTTSGAQNINSMLTITPNATGPGTASAYSANGQTFATPAALSAFVNQQVPGANTTAANVFQYLQSQGGANTGSGTVAGGNSTLNPVANIPSIAQQVVNGTLSYSDALAQGGSVANFSGALNQAITSLQPGFNFNTAQGSSAAQQATAQTQQQTQAAYSSAEQQASNLGNQLNNLVTTYNLNPSDLTAVNGVIQTIAKNTSSAQYQALNNYLADLAGVWSPVFSASGDTTDATRYTASSMMNSLASGTSLSSVLAALQSAAQAKIAGVQTTPITNSQGSGVGDNGSSLYDF